MPGDVEDGLPAVVERRPDVEATPWQRVVRLVGVDRLVVDHALCGPETG
jgi:hypothetical protein